MCVWLSVCHGDRQNSFRLQFPKKMGFENGRAITPALVYRVSPAVIDPGGHCVNIICSTANHNFATLCLTVAMGNG